MSIKNVEDLVKRFIPNGFKYVSYESENLLAAGENYGSVMLQVQIKVINDKNEEEEIPCVAKITPPSEVLWELFNTKLTFKKEIGTYKTIVPTINEFGKEKGIENIFDFFAKSLGARISLDAKSDVVDEHAVLLLENLKVQGYEVCDRFQGFDLTTSKLILRDLAIFHAVPIALRLHKPDVFKETILKNVERHFALPSDEEMIKNLIKSMGEAVAQNPKCVPHLSKLKEGLLNLKALVKYKPRTLEPFVTLTHNDVWTNNIMVKFEDGKPTKSKFVDFQLTEYSSPAQDLIFFLYSSVAMEVLESGVDDLIKYYYDEFIDTLKKFKCDLSLFSFKAFSEELAVAAKEEQFSHILFMLVPIFTLKGKITELSELKLTDLDVSADRTHKNFYKRLQFVLLDFVERGWI